MQKQKKTRPKPLALIMLEGWGIAPAGEGNAISAAKTPFIDRLASQYPVATLAASSEAIGLSAGMSGSSRSGHSIIGTGRPWKTSLSTVSKHLLDADFSSNEIFSKIKERIVTGKRLHMMGLLSSSEEEVSLTQLSVLLEALSEQSFKDILFHPVLDGRESAHTAGQRLVHEFEATLDRLKIGKIATLVGRFYALDEKYNTTRLDKALNLLTAAEGKESESAEEAIADSYAKKIFDEELAPAVITNSKFSGVANGDVVFFWNHAGSSSRALLKRLMKALPDALIITLSDYCIDGTLPLFSEHSAHSSIGKLFASKGLRQLRLGDSAGFPGVAAWLDGLVEEPIEKVDRQLIATQAHNTVAEAALDSIKGIRRAFVEAVQHGHYDFIAVTFSQPDTAAHGASFDELTAILEKLDDALRVMMETIETAGGVAFITGTHGLAERLVDPATGVHAPHHSTNPVPLYIVGSRFAGYNLGWPEAVGGDLSLLTPIGSLVDIAPTLIGIAGFKKPVEMTGRNLAS